MSSIKPLDLLLISELFERENEAGYVLNFSDRTFSEFFARQLNINIDEPAYAQDGKGKLKRLRRFLQMTDDTVAVQTLRALWDYREELRNHFGADDHIKDGHARLLNLIHRLEGKPPKTAPPPKPVLVTDGARLAQLRQDLLALGSLDPHPRGYAFEKFLKELFDAYGMEGREPFRIKGEQIDGSFLMSGETYLVEAKWQKAMVDAADLRAFNGKVEEKAAWARGLFITHGGFSEDGLYAFGRGKRLICMDGYDLYETLNRGLNLTDVLSRKVRRAAETGNPFMRVRDIFPT